MVEGDRIELSSNAYKTLMLTSTPALHMVEDERFELSHRIAATTVSLANRYLTTRFNLPYFGRQGRTCTYDVSMWGIYSSLPSLLGILADIGTWDVIRTRTWWILSPLPLPLGYSSIFKPTFRRNSFATDRFLTNNSVKLINWTKLPLT